MRVEGQDDSISVQSKLENTYKNGEKTILFGYGSSGSGKTYTLINNTAAKSTICEQSSCNSIMFQFVKKAIDS